MLTLPDQPQKGGPRLHSDDDGQLEKGTVAFQHFMSCMSCRWFWIQRTQPAANQKCTPAATQATDSGHCGSAIAGTTATAATRVSVRHAACIIHYHFHSRRRPQQDVLSQPFHYHCHAECRVCAGGRSRQWKAGGATLEYSRGAEVCSKYQFYTPPPRGGWCIEAVVSILVQS